MAMANSTRRTRQSVRSVGNSMSLSTATMTIAASVATGT